MRMGELRGRDVEEVDGGEASHMSRQRRPCQRHTRLENVTRQRAVHWSCSFRNPAKGVQLLPERNGIHYIKRKNSRS